MKSREETIEIEIELTPNSSGDTNIHIGLTNGDSREVIQATLMNGMEYQTSKPWIEMVLQRVKNILENKVRAI